MRNILFIYILFFSNHLFAEEKKTDAIKTDTTAKGGFKAYNKLITDKAITQKGLFTIHKIEDKYYFEIPDSIMNREIMVTTRFDKIAGGGFVYAGEMDNEQTILFEKGPNKNIFMRIVTLVSLADSTNAIYKAVSNSNINPIAANFEIKAIGKDSTSWVIEVTDFLKGDNIPIGVSSNSKKRLNLGGQIADRSYISSVKSFPINTEVRTVRTFSSTPSSGPSTPFSASLPAAYTAGAVTLEMNNSFILLPKVQMKKRLYDNRVGFFADDFTAYADNQQRAENRTFIVRWRLEPKPEDAVKLKNGQLVEPQKPIVYYIDPATPKKWRPYLIQGINDWQKAFEHAGFKNAIIGKEWPENDSTMSLDDARFSVLRYLPSDIPNAYGPNVHDPRSGEIIESHIGWYHNVMKLVHNWYMIQAANIDPRARKMEFEDSLMGQLIRFVSSHEVGHTLGLRHNMGSSSRTPVEKLRDKNWVEANGHTASIMDYARFNYVAQPEDNITEKGIYPRIGDYDKWAIQWGYSLTNAKDEKEDQKIVNHWIVDSLKANSRLWFGTESNPFDPHSQTEDLGDNNMVASSYGIKNLQKILPQLPLWTKEEADLYNNLDEMYAALVDQWARYMSHVLRNVGGIYEVPKSVEQQGDVYEPTPKNLQQDAIRFLHQQLFETPQWILNKEVLNKVKNPISNDLVPSVQTKIINGLLNVDRLNRISLCSKRFGDNKTYPLEDMMEEVKKGIWSELSSKKPIDAYRRDLQKTYIDNLISLISTSTPASNSASNMIFIFGTTNYKNTDVASVARAQLVSLKTEINAALPPIVDRMSKYHLLDIANRIKMALEPNSLK